MSEFTSGIIDIGIVVRDLTRSVAFYRDVIGFEETGFFDVSAPVGADAGLADNRPFQVHMMELAGTHDGTTIKLIQFADAAVGKTAFIHSETGVRYLTIRVPDISAACRKAARAGCKPIAKGPAPFDEDTWLAVIRDPDGNMIELVGPKK